MPSPARSSGGAAMDPDEVESDPLAALPSSPRDGWESVAASDDHGRGWELVAAGRGTPGYDDACSVFPPSDHEGLHVEQSFMAASEGGVATAGGGGDPMAASSSPPSSSVSSSGGGVEACKPGWHEGGAKPLVELARRAVRSGYELLYSTLPRPRVVVGGGFGRVKHGVVWSSAAVVGLAAVLLLCVRRRHQRERLRLLLLIQQKDQLVSTRDDHLWPSSLQQIDDLYSSSNDIQNFFLLVQASLVRPLGASTPTNTTPEDKSVIAPNCPNE